MMPGAKPTVSTTSVSPSQRPIEWPPRLGVTPAGWLAHVHVNRPREPAAVLHRDGAVALRDAVDRAVEHPIEQNARDLAARARAVLGRLGAQHVGFGLAGRRERHGARAPPGVRHVGERDLPRLDAGDHALRHEPAAAFRRTRDQSTAPAPSRRRRSARRSRAAPGGPHAALASPSSAADSARTSSSSSFSVSM